MLTQDTLAIIIPAYKPDFLKKALLSLSQQTCKNFTLYIGDDNSPHHLEKIIAPFYNQLNIIYKKFDTNIGGKDLVAQWERCINLTNEEEWLWLFSDDDIMGENCVQLFFQEINKNKDKYDLYHFDVIRIDENDKQTANPYNYPIELDSLSFYRRKITGNLLSLVIENIFSRSIYNEMKGFQSFDLAWGSDTASWCKFTSKRPMKTIHGDYVYWRSSSQNISSIMTPQIAERKIAALLNFFRWSLDFFEKDKIIIYNYLGFIKRLPDYKKKLSPHLYNAYINQFCNLHFSFHIGILSITKLLVNILILKKKLC